MQFELMLRVNYILFVSGISHLSLSLCNLPVVFYCYMVSHSVNVSQFIRSVNGHWSGFPSLTNMDNPAVDILINVFD